MRAAVFVGAEHDAGKALAAVLRKEGFNPGEVAGESVPVLDPGQRAVDPGGADLQRPGAGDRVIDVDRGADVVADLLAIVDRDLRPVGTVGHDLHGRPFASQDGDAHEFEAHEFEARRDDRGQLAFQAGAAQPGEVVDVGSFPSKPGRPKQKEAAREGHPRINSGE